MRKFKKLFSLLLVLVLLISGCSNKTGSQTKTDGTNNFKAGSYESSADGYGGAVKLKVTFSQNKIEKIETIDLKETPTIGGQAIETLIKEVLAKQSLALDVITGATVSSKAFIKALEATVKQAGGNLEALKKVAANSQKLEPINLTSDVLVIGGGGAGLSAAVSAASEKAQVILLEKTGALGGNTIRAGGPYNAVDPKRQKNIKPADQASMDKAMALTSVTPKNERHAQLQAELKKELAQYQAGDHKSLFDSNTLHKLQTYDGGDYIGNLEFIETLVDKSLETSEWMAQNGVTWTDNITTVPGGLWPRAHIPAGAAGGDYIKAFSNKATSLGVKILLNSPVTELIVENGKVVGVKGTSNGAPLEVKAKSVIIATGGFSANKAMRKQYMPSLGESLPTTNSPAITGDGITMTRPIKAGLIGMEWIQSLPLGNPENGGLNGWVGGAGVEYYYQINKAGKRFMAEDGRRDTMTKALLAQEDQMSYVISSAENKLEVEPNETIWGDKIDKLVADKKIYRADTIEELAKQINIEPKVLKETHDKFNAYVEAGKDQDFGRTLFGKPLVTGPFYASPRVPTVHHTMGGLAINLDGQVLDEASKPIENLYAAGEVTGGIHGANRLGGNALVDIHVFGRQAGLSAAKHALKK